LIRREPSHRNIRPGQSPGLFSLGSEQAETAVSTTARLTHVRLPEIHTGAGVPRYESKLIIWPEYWTRREN